MTSNGSIRFIHSSDWQLGMTRAFFEEEAASRFSQARIDTIARLGELADEHHALFIVVAGDVFESNQLSRQMLARALDSLSSLPVPVLLLPGNHDPLDGSSIFNTREFLESPDHVIVIRDTKPISIPGVAGVEVVGAPWPTKHPSRDLCADVISNLEKNDKVVRILVAHGQVDKVAPDSTKPEIINLDVAESAIGRGLLHYLALGDRHSVTDVGSTGRIWYSGAPLVTAFDEVEPNKALLVDIEGGGRCMTQSLEVGRWRFLAEHFVINSHDDVKTFAESLDATPDKVRTAVKVGFEGSVNLATAAALDEVMDTRAELFASLRRRERTTDLVIAPDHLDQDSVSLTGYAKEAWDELVLSAQDGDETAQDALRLFYRFTRKEII